MKNDNRKPSINGVLLSIVSSECDVEKFNEVRVSCHCFLRNQASTLVFIVQKGQINPKTSAN